MDPRRPILLALLFALAWGAPADAQEPAEPAAPTESEDARDLFFEGLDLQEAGQLAAAVGNYQKAILLDPALHQVRIRLAECYYDLDRNIDALEQLKLYLEADFPGQEVGRARLLVVACGADPDVLLGSGEPGDGDGGRGGRHKGVWAPARLEIGPQLVHFQNDIGLTAGGPVVAMRFLPFPYMELIVQGRAALGPYPDQEGFVAVIDVAPGVDASIPLGPTRLVAGAVVPFLFSRYGGGVRVDAGIVAALGVRVPVGATRLVLGVQLEGGYLVTPTVGGSLRFGFQLGPMGEAP